MIDMDDKETWALVKKMDAAMEELLEENPSLLHSVTYTNWMCLMMDMGVEPDMTESYQILGSYQFEDPS